LLETKTEVTERDLGKQPLSEKELDALIGERPYLGFLNTRNELYRDRKMKENPPSRREAVRLMAANPNLIRRPIFTRGNDLTLGFDIEKLTKLIK
jgi:arsenate reductase-like glutaredoxin family protein